MSQEELKCTSTECKQRLIQAETMSIRELEEYATRCASCGNWILKDNAIAQQTYQRISIRYAEAHNDRLITESRK